MALVGRVARTHGLRGDVVVNPETDFVAERFAPGRTVWTRSAAGGEEELTIGSSRIQGGRPVVRFEGLSRIEDAERLAGLELRVPEETLQPLEPGHYYAHELVGCVLETVEGDRLGVVARVEGSAGSQRLAVDGVHGEMLIPLAVDICVEIDAAAKRIRVAPPEGLLALNERQDKPGTNGTKRTRTTRTIRT
jgi:16S rRNA processing protein RimM